MGLIHHPAELLAARPHSTGRPSPLALLSITAAALFMAADITITNVALPAIALDLDAPVSSLQWVVDAYNIAVTGLLLLGTGAGERFGRRRVFLAGVGLFLVGSLAAGLSGTIEALVAARALMGVGGALIVGPAMSLIATLYAPEQRTRAVAAWAAAGSLGLALGPIAGGLAIDIADWPWVFWVNVPFMLAALVVGRLSIPDDRRTPGVAADGRGEPRLPLDAWGALLSVLALGLLVGAIIEGPGRGWTSPLVLGCALVGSVALGMFVWRERTCAHPMFDVRVLARRDVLGAFLALFSSYFAFTGSIFLVAQQLQVGHTLTPIALGLCLVPLAVSLWLVSSRASSLAQSIGGTRAMLAGMGLLVLAFVALALTAPWDSIPAMVVGTVVAAAGAGVLIPIGSVAILNGLPPSLTGSASGTSMLARFAGASIGIAVLGTVLASAGSDRPHRDSVAFATAVGWAAAAGALALLALLVAVALLLARRDAH